MTRATHIPPDPAHAAGAGHETSDASAAGIVIFAAVMLGVVALLSVFIWHQLHDYQANNRRMDGEPSPFVNTRPPPPEPQLQPSYQSHDTLPYQDMDLLKEQWTTELATYGPVPGREGLARIPIDRAMDIFAERGLPTPSGVATTAPTTQPATPPKPIGGGR